MLRRRGLHWRCPSRSAIGSASRRSACSEKPCQTFTCWAWEQSHDASHNVFQNTTFGQWASFEGLRRPREKQGSGAVHTAFNRPTSSRVDLLLDLMVRSSLEQRASAHPHLTGTCQRTVGWCLGRGLLLRDWFLQFCSRSERSSGCAFSEAICFRVRASVHSHALFLLQSPIFGLLFLYQPL